MTSHALLLQVQKYNLDYFASTLEHFTGRVRREHPNTSEVKRTRRRARYHRARGFYTGVLVLHVYLHHVSKAQPPAAAGPERSAQILQIRQQTSRTNTGKTRCTSHAHARTCTHVLLSLTAPLCSFVISKVASSPGRTTPNSHLYHVHTNRKSCPSRCPSLESDSSPTLSGEAPVRAQHGHDDWMKGTRGVLRPGWRSSYWARLKTSEILPVSAPNQGEVLLHSGP